MTTLKKLPFPELAISILKDELPISCFNFGGTNSAFRTGAKAAVIMCLTKCHIPAEANNKVVEALINAAKNWSNTTFLDFVYLTAEAIIKLNGQSLVTIALDQSAEFDEGRINLMALEGCIADLEGCIADLEKAKVANSLQEECPSQSGRDET